MEKHFNGRNWHDPESGALCDALNAAIEFMHTVRRSGH
jgi:hypothetical protein